MFLRYRRQRQTYWHKFGLSRLFRFLCVCVHSAKQTQNPIGLREKKADDGKLDQISPGKSMESHWEVGSCGKSFVVEACHNVILVREKKKADLIHQVIPLGLITHIHQSFSKQNIL